ncbi:MAG: hypothetical protein ABI778_07800 [Ignavibacteriota bacterium]
MKLHFILFLCLIFLCGTGCHQSSPSSVFTNSTADSTLLVKHYPEMHLVCTNVFFFDHYNVYRSIGGTITNTFDTITEAFFKGIGSALPNFIVDSSSLMSNGVIHSLSGYYSSAYSSGKVEYLDIPYTQLPDSSLYIILNGSSATKYIVDMHGSMWTAQFFWRGHDSNGNSASYTEEKTENIDYIRCTDSSRIEITMKYKK